MEIDPTPDNALQQQEPERHYEGNALLRAFYPGLQRLLDDATPSDDDVEIVGQSKKRPAPSTSNGTDKRARPDADSESQGSPLEVLHLHYLLPAVNAKDEVKGERKAFVKALRASPSLQHPHPLTAIEFTHSRTRAQPAPRRRNAAREPQGHEIIVTTPESRSVLSCTKLLQLSSIDRNEESHTGSFGEGSVLDASLLMRDQGYLEVKGVVSVSPPPEGEQWPTFYLSIAISLLPSFFTLRLPSIAKRIFVERVCPPSPAIRAEAGTVASVGMFYASLKRAPRTRDGVPVIVSAGGSKSRSKTASRARTPQPAETEEEKATRLRREAKGKYRAVSTPPPEPGTMDIDDAGDGESEQPLDDDEFEGNAEEEDRGGVEDELLYPEGLVPTLMPFQSRSVRWMLSREGKRVVMRHRKGSEEQDEAGPSGQKSNGKRKEEVQGGEEEVHLDHSDDLDLDHEHHSDPEEDDENRPAPVLEDLPEEELRAQRRGPLWEAFTIDLPPPLLLPDEDESRTKREDTEAGGKQQVWLNRVTNSLSLDDPGIRIVKDEDDEEVEVVDDEFGSDDEEKKSPSQPNDEQHWGSGDNGLLAEEVGLGKTVEVLSLILINPDRERSKLKPYFNSLTDSEVQPTGVTLVIAPSAIVGQWQSEIAKHAPSLRVLRYDSIKKVKESWTAKYIAKHFDIVLTTFDVLRREVVLARKPHERATRSGPDGKARYRRSLLVQIDFLRIIMDEAQMVGDSVSATSETASLIPRKFSWAVTSTPLKSRLEDMQGLLAFLRVEPFGDNRAALPRLLEEKESFKRLLGTIGARTLKAQVDHELVIPEQDRFVVPVDFGAVEKYWYESRYKEALDALGLDRDTGLPKEQEHDPITEGLIPWTPVQADLNRWLVSLRQACCHPQIGAQAKEKLGKVLKTVDDVLSSMREQAIGAVLSDQRTLLFTRVKRAQWMCYDKEDCERFEEALQLFGATLLDLEPVIEEVVTSVKEAWVLRKARLQRSASVSTSSSGEENDIAHALGLGLGDEEDDENGDQKLTEKDRALIKNLGALRNRLRDLLSIQHKCYFFSGSAYFNMGKFPDEEAEMYAKAERLRGAMLAPYEKQVDRAARRLADQQNARDEKEGELDIRALEWNFSKLGHGLAAIEAFEDAETAIDQLNGYGELAFSWRESIFEMMKTGVSIADDEVDPDADPDEMTAYEKRGALQEKANAYLEAYGALLAEMRKCVTGEHSALGDQLLADINNTEKKNTWMANPLHEKRRKKNVYIPLKDRRVPTIDQGDTPEEILRFELLVERIQAKGEDQEEVEAVPIRQVITRLKEAATTVESDKERHLIEKERGRLDSERKIKEKVYDRLRAELADITSAFNARLAYFAQLQVLSDEVADPNFGNRFKGFIAEQEAMVAEEEKLEASIVEKQSTRRYLETIHADAAETAQEDTTCVICSDVFTHGVLTTCAHLCCQACFTAWHARSSQCPLCRRPLRRGDWEVVKYRQPRPENGEGGDDNDGVEMLDAALPDETPIKLSTISGNLLAAIDDIDTVAPLSSKSDAIVKHVAYIRRTDPTAKCLVFSAWDESLAILMQAFNRNGIQYVRLEAGGKKEAIVSKFNDDPDIAAFFLHTKSQSAGLNLVAASYVFLVEPLLHPSLEVQAIARVHRIGQQNKTTVFQYAIMNSVDERVAHLRARQGTSLFLPSSKKMNPAKTGQAGQRDMAARSKRAAGDEALDDEDDSTRCLLEPEHYIALQRSLLPARLRNAQKEVNGQEAAGRAGQAAIARAEKYREIRDGAPNDKRDSRKTPEFKEHLAECREARELSDLQARAASLQQQLDELQRREGGASAATQIDSRPEKEQVRQLQRELKGECKQLDAEIAEQVLARERAEIELAKLEEEEKSVAESEKAVAVLEEELKIKQEEVEEVNGKIKILEGTLERLRKRESGAEHDNGSLDLSARESCEAVAGDNLDKPSQPTSASHTSSLEPQVPAARIESDLGEPSYQNYQQELKRLREQTLAEQRKAEELEARLRELEDEAISASFNRNGIQYVRLEAGGKKEAIVSKCNDDPDIAAFFLHTKSQSAGLNLVAASYVFLVEPLLHPSLEVQAIARVHRIGQQNKTTVFQYAIMNSVDERVAHLRARQGISLFLPSSKKMNPAWTGQAGQRHMAARSKRAAGAEARARATGRSRGMIS